mmetsp:Transcript_748/g.3031  ORF Transcript_748/g.3031 Transcript_748/m.3031 type:complete len:266 (+) Transcript_748:127-924(+)
MGLAGRGGPGRRSVSHRPDDPSGPHADSRGSAGCRGDGRVHLGFPGAAFRGAAAPAESAHGVLRRDTARQNSESIQQGCGIHRRSPSDDVLRLPAVLLHGRRDGRDHLRREPRRADRHAASRVLLRAAAEDVPPQQPPDQARRGAHEIPGLLLHRRDAAGPPGDPSLPAAGRDQQHLQRARQREHEGLLQLHRLEQVVRLPTGPDRGHAARRRGILQRRAQARGYGIHRRRSAARDGAGVHPAACRSLPVDGAPVRRGGEPNDQH